MFSGGKHSTGEAILNKQPHNVSAADHRIAHGHVEDGSFREFKSLKAFVVDVILNN